MKQYLLSVWGDEEALYGEEVQADLPQVYADVDVFNTKLKDAGHWVFAGGLEASSTASVVRDRGGEVIVTDGPFAEAREQLGGFWVIRADDLDVALALAREATVACRAAVEVRPFQDDPEVES